MPFQGTYYVKDFPITDKFVPGQLLLGLPNVVKARVFEQFSIRTGMKKPLVKIYDASILVQYTKPKNEMKFDAL